MNDNTGAHPKIAALRERLDAFTAAILRVSASLDVDTVMRASAEAARALGEVSGIRGNRGNRADSVAVSGVSAYHGDRAFAGSVNRLGRGRD